MITRPQSRPQSLLRALAKQAQPTSSALPRQPFQRRCKHDLPRWGNEARQQYYAQHGVPGFLSAETFNETYIQYSRHLIDKLNTLTLGTADEDVGAHQLHLKYAHRADKAHLYNVSAMLNFTRFFWEDCLTESTDPEGRKPGLLTMRSIEQAFGTVEMLREEMLETADAMFGNGFVWLMKGRGIGDMKILATYNAGSPYKEAAPRRDDRDMATQGGNGQSLSDQLSGYGLRRKLEEQDISVGNSSAGSFGDYSANRTRQYAGALDMQPILCVNVWEHQWMRDYGVSGKKAYLTEWWDHIDWQKVEMVHNLQEWADATTFQQTMPAYSSTRGSSVLDALRR